MKFSYKEIRQITGNFLKGLEKEGVRSYTDIEGWVGTDIIISDCDRIFFNQKEHHPPPQITSISYVRDGSDIPIEFRVNPIVGFGLVIVKNTKAKEIYGVELNKAAHKYALENIKLNKVKNIYLYNGDVKTIVPKLKKKFDRVIMPLPASSEDYLSLALKHLKKGGKIHLYLFEKEENFAVLKKKYKKIFKKVKLVKAGAIGAGKYRVCLDLAN